MTHAWRRFWARQLDYQVFALAVVVLMVMYAGPDSNLLLLFLGNTGVIGIALVFAFVFVETALLSSFGTTPGKWLLAISIKDQHGNNPSLPMSMARSLSVWVRGVAMGIPLVQILTFWYSYGELLAKQRSQWDEYAGTHVTVSAMDSSRLILLVLALILTVICALYIGAMLGMHVDTGGGPARSNTTFQY